MSDPTLAETLDTIAAKAKGLRDAGVRTIEIGNVFIELAPHDPPEPTGVTDDRDPDFDDPLDDPSTYGRKKSVPRRRDPDDDE